MADFNFTFEKKTKNYNSIGSKYSYYHKLSEYEANKPATLDDFLGFSPNEGLLQKIISLPVNALSIPVRTVMGGIDNMVQGKSVVSGLGKGFSGKINKAPTDVMKDAGVNTDNMNPLAKFALNLGIYSMLDPLAIYS